MICFGTGLATSQSLSTDGENVGLGLILVLLSTMAAGSRWAIAQLMLQKGMKKMSALEALYYTAPVCTICLIPIVAIKELPSLMESDFVKDGAVAAQTFGLLCCGMLMAFMLILAEYALVARFVHNSPITMHLVWKLP